MIKPILPKKPRKYQPPPSRIELIAKYVMTKENGEIVLLTPEEYDKTNEELKIPQREVDGLDNLGEKITYFDMVNIKNCLSVPDFSIWNEVCCDGYYDHTVLSYTQTKPDAQFQKEMDDYNNRFVVYEQKLEEYRKQMDVYVKWKNEQKVKKLQAEIRKYE